MDTKNFYGLQKSLKEQNIMFCYSGYVTERILSAIGETIKKKLAIEETELGKTKKPHISYLYLIRVFMTVWMYAPHTHFFYLHCNSLTTAK